jgi:hypothetical protein
VNALVALVQTTPSPSASRIVIEPPPASGTDIVIAVLAIVFAVAAGVVGYRIIRGGRGL